MATVVAIVAVAGAVVALLVFARWLIGLIAGQQREIADLKVADAGKARDLASWIVRCNDTTAALVAERRAHVETEAKYRDLAASAMHAATDEDAVALAGGDAAPAPGGVPEAVIDGPAASGIATDLR